ncbi:hypothetical protein Q3G72_006947 [Acer saccharum]|nr:hypothetical protein Q3G72_006947 [Acer saccharum]
MGFAVPIKSPSSFIAFVFCFLLISFLFNIPHPIAAQRVKNGASSVHGSPLKHDSNAAAQRGSPEQSSPTKISNEKNISAIENCSFENYLSCRPPNMPSQFNQTAAKSFDFRTPESVTP